MIERIITDIEPVVRMAGWILVEVDYSANDRKIAIIIGNEDNSEYPRRSTPIISLKKHNGSDFEWIAETKSGRHYILPRKGYNKLNQGVNHILNLMYDQAEESLDDDSDHGDQVSVNLVTIEEYLKDYSND